MLLREEDEEDKGKEDDATLVVEEDEEGDEEGAGNISAVELSGRFAVWDGIKVSDKEEGFEAEETREEMVEE